jgi:hypothetical protein
VAPKDTTKPPGSGRHLTAQEQQRQQQPNAMIEKAVVPVGCTPSTPNCLLRELACFGYWLVHHGLQLGSSGEIEDKDLSRAVGFDRDLVRSLSNLNYGGVLSESFKQFKQRIAIRGGVPTGAASQAR